MMVRLGIALLAIVALLLLAVVALPLLLFWLLVSKGRPLVRAISAPLGYLAFWLRSPVPTLAHRHGTLAAELAGLQAQSDQAAAAYQDAERAAIGIDEQLRAARQLVDAAPGPRLLAATAETAQSIAGESQRLDGQIADGERRVHELSAEHARVLEEARQAATARMPTLAELLDQFERHGYQTAPQPITARVGTLSEDELARPIGLELLEMPATLLVGDNASEMEGLVRHLVLEVALRASPREVQLRLIDLVPGTLALSPLAGLPHVLGGRVARASEAAAALVDALRPAAPGAPHTYRLVVVNGVGSSGPMSAEFWDDLGRAVTSTPTDFRLLITARAASPGDDPHAQILLAAQRASGSAVLMPHATTTSLTGISLGRAVEQAIAQQAAGACPEPARGQAVVGAGAQAELVMLDQPPAESLLKRAVSVSVDRGRDLTATYSLEEELAKRAAAPRWDATSPFLTPIVGTDQYGTPHGVDLTRGHLLIAGPSGSGKSTLLRGLVLQLALHNHPRALRLLLLDLDRTGDLASLVALPHVDAAVSSAADAERVLREALAGIEQKSRASGKEHVIVALEGAHQTGPLAAQLDDLLYRGPRLGLHVLATHRPGTSLGDGARYANRLVLSADRAERELRELRALPAHGLREGEAVLVAGSNGPIGLRAALLASKRLDELTEQCAARGGEAGLRSAVAARAEAKGPVVALEDLFREGDQPLVCRWSSPRDELVAPLGRIAGTREIQLIRFSEGGAEEESTVHTFFVGTTGTGKTNGLNALLLSLAFTYSPADVRFVVLALKNEADFRKFELPHHRADAHVTRDPQKAYELLRRVVLEEDRRNRQFDELVARGMAVSDISAYRRAGFRDMPSLVVVVDEPLRLRNSPGIGRPAFALMEELATRGRSSGIHLVIAAQSNDWAVLTERVRSNVRGRIVLRLERAYDSRLLLGDDEGVRLNRKGEAIYQSGAEGQVRSHFDMAFADPERRAEYARAIEEALAGHPIPGFELPPLPEDPASAVALQTLTSQDRDAERQERYRRSRERTAERAQRPGPR